MAKEVSRAPFGIATKRFANIGFHPLLDVSGTYKKDPTNLCPFSYNPKSSGCKFKRGMDWKRKVEIEEYSKYLNYKNLDLLHELEFNRTLGGPATIDMSVDIYKKQNHSVFKNVGFGLDTRIKDTKRNDVPPPDSYYRRKEQLSTLKTKSFSKLPTFERDGFVGHFRSNAPKYTLAPNRYNLANTNGTDQILKKVVSLRGPYDLFTGPRDNSTIKNHFTPSTTKTPEYNHIEPSTIDVLLHHPSKRSVGVFLKCKRFPKKPCVRNMLIDLSLCYRNPKDPGPAHYDLTQIKSINEDKPNLYPFNTSYQHARPPMNWKISPGPGRYSPKTPKCLKHKRPSWVFVSKESRTITKVKS